MSRLRFLRHLSGDFRRSILPAPHRPAPQQWSADEVTVALLGHATILINFFGLHILTDPVFFSRIGIGLGPVVFGPKRYVACALRPAELPRIDVLLLSHAHMDHLDLRSIRKVNRDCAVIMAEKTFDLIDGYRFREIHELAWNEATRLETPAGTLEIAAFKLRHWGARMQWDVQRKYNAYVLERNGRRLCFCGDTARTDASALGSRGPIDLLMAPIGAYHPWITNHCTPEEAVAMADEAGARFVMPFHFETFKLSWEPMDEPIQRFRTALSSDPKRIALSEIGQSFVLPKG